MSMGLRLTAGRRSSAKNNIETRGFRQNTLSVYERLNSGFSSAAGTSWASNCAIFVKCSLKASAMSPGVLIVLLSFG